MLILLTIKSNVCVDRIKHNAPKIMKCFSLRETDHISRLSMFICEVVGISLRKKLKLFADRQLFWLTLPPRELITMLVFKVYGKLKTNCRFQMIV